MIEVKKKGLEVDAKGNLVVVEKQTQPTKATKNKVAKIKLVREIYGIKLSTKLPKEVKAVIQVIENNKGKGFISFDILFSQYCKELSKVSNSKSNLKTRFRRILYRTVEGVILKKSIQSAKFNLKANIKGIKVQSQLNIEYKTNGDAITNSVDTNSFKFVVAEKVETRKTIVATKSDIARATKLSIS